jgi:hypothetical protein
LDVYNKFRSRNYVSGISISPDAGDKETMTQLSKEAVIVRSALEAKGLETPMLHTAVSAHEKKQQKQVLPIR